MGRKECGLFVEDVCTNGPIFIYSVLFVVDDLL